VGLCEGERRAGPAVIVAAAKCTAANPPLLRTWAYPPWRVPAAGAAAVGRFMDRQSKREILILAIGTIMVEVPVAAIAVIAILAH